MFMNWKKMLLALWRIEEQQQEILARLDRMETPSRTRHSSADQIKDLEPRVPQGEGVEKQKDEWLQEGIDNIMAFQAGNKRSERE